MFLHKEADTAPSLLSTDSSPSVLRTGSNTCFRDLTVCQLVSALFGSHRCNYSTHSLSTPVMCICSDLLRIKSTATGRAIDRAMAHDLCLDPGLQGSQGWPIAFLGDTGRITPGPVISRKSLTFNKAQMRQRCQYGHSGSASNPGFDLDITGTC